MSSNKKQKTGSDLTSLPISTMLEGRRYFGILACDTHTKQHEAVEFLAKYNLQGMPIWDQENGYTGLVSLQDLLLPTIFGFSEGELKNATAERLGQKLLFDKELGEFKGVTEESKTLWTFKPEDSISDLLHHFCAGVHRVLIDSAKIRFLSQSDVVRYLYAHREELGGALTGITSKKLGEFSSLSIGKPLVTVNAKDTALHSFRTLGKQDVSAVPVVDDRGVCIDVLSYSDLKGLNRSNLKDLLLPTREYLFKRNPNTKYPGGVHCLATDTLEDAMKKLVGTNIHRVWVTDNNGKPLGAVSLTDVIRVVFLKDN